MYQFRVFPEKKLTVVRYFGRIHLEEIKQVCREVFIDPGYKPEFMGLSDERQADIVMSPREAEQLAHFIQQETPVAGRWAHLINTPRSAVSANEYGRHCEEFHENNIFSSMEATAEYLEMAVDELETYIELVPQAGIDTQCATATMSSPMHKP